MVERLFVLRSFWLVLFLFRPALCQITDIEDKFYRLFVFSSEGPLSGKEYQSCCPGEKNDSSGYAVCVKTDFHDIFRQWNMSHGNNQSNYQSDMGIAVKMPARVSHKDFNLFIEMQRTALYSDNNSEYKSTQFSGKNCDSYMVKCCLQHRQNPDSYGLSVEYTTGKNEVGLKIDKYPQNITDALQKRYFYNLLEPAFGNLINFSLSGHELNYALEYIKEFSPSFDLGVNFCHNSCGYSAGIKYFSRVERIEGEKKQKLTLQLIDIP